MSDRPMFTRLRYVMEHDGDGDERGEVLVLVLGLLVVVGMLVGALAGLSTPIFVHAGVVRNLNDTVAAADSGIKYGIQTLQGNPAPCLGQPNLVDLLNRSGGPPPQVNGRTVQVQCQTVNGPVNGISSIELVSIAQPVNGATAVTAKAVVQVNDTTGSATVMSWRTCQDPQC